MTATALRREESLGLALALVGHVAMIAWLVWQRAPAPVVLPERMTVTISEDVGLTAAAPQQAAPEAAAAPVPGEAPPPPEPTPQSQPPAPSPAAAAPPPRPAPVQASKPAIWPFAKPARVIPSGTSALAVSPPRPSKPGASAFDNAFKSGIAGAKPGGTAASAAAPITGAVRNSLAGAVARKIKPKWRGRVPEGLDAEKLVTILTWDLNPDGSLSGSPRVVRQDGITPANRAQAARHAEEAIRAVRLAAPFDLPPQYYAAWKHISDFRFDKSLGQ